MTLSLSARWAKERAGEFLEYYVVSAIVSILLSYHIQYLHAPLQEHFVGYGVLHLNL